MRRTAIVLALYAIIALHGFTMKCYGEQGLTGTYFSQQDLTVPVFSRVDAQINFDWSISGPGGGIGLTKYSVLWKGSIQSSFSETYTFSAISDDGFVLWIDGNPVISNWTDHAATVNAASLPLIAGQAHSIEIAYYQDAGLAVARLSWSSHSTPLQIIPSSAFATSAPATTFAIATPAASRISPAWVEGTIGSDVVSGSIFSTIDGSATALRLEGASGWYLSPAPQAGRPLGIPLTNQHPTNLRFIDATSGSVVGGEILTWEVTDLSNLPYGLQSLTVRSNDQLLLTASKAGTTLILTSAYTSGTAAPAAPVVVATGRPGQHFAVPFAAAGTYAVTALVDGKPVGSLNVYVAAVDLRGPIACLVGFQRIKDVMTTEPSAAQPIVFTADAADRLLVSIKQVTAADTTLYLQPLTEGRPVLQARIGDAHGPIVAAQPIDVFTMSDSASSYITIVQAYPDGSLLCEGTMTMIPLVRALDFHMQAYIAGVTFPDSTTSMTVSTDLFTPDGFGGQYTYQIIRGPSDTGHVCHTWSVTQAGIPISP